MFVPRLLNALDRALTSATGRYAGIEDGEENEAPPPVSTSSQIIADGSVPLEAEKGKQLEGSALPVESAEVSLLANAETGAEHLGAVAATDHGASVASDDNSHQDSSADATSLGMNGGSERDSKIDGLAGSDLRADSKFFPSANSSSSGATAAMVSEHVCSEYHQRKSSGTLADLEQNESAEESTAKLMERAGNEAAASSESEERQRALHGREIESNRSAISEAKLAAQEAASVVVKERMKTAPPDTMSQAEIARMQDEIKREREELAKVRLREEALARERRAEIEIELKRERAALFQAKQAAEAAVREAELEKKKIREATEKAAAQAAANFLAKLPENDAQPREEDGNLQTGEPQDEDRVVRNLAAEAQGEQTLQSAAVGEVKSGDSTRLDLVARLRGEQEKNRLEAVLAYVDNSVGVVEEARRQRAVAAQRSKLKDLSVAAGSELSDFASQGVEGSVASTSASASAAGSPFASPATSPRRRRGNREGPHDFQKLRSRRGVLAQDNAENLTCMCCGGLWEDEEDRIGGRRRFSGCSTCGALVHSGCRSFFQRCNIACTAGLLGSKSTPRGAVGVRWSEVNQQGEVCVVVQQAIQLGVSSGDAVYAILRLVPWKEEVKTPLATWGDMGAIWSSSTSAPLPATPGALSLVHIYNGSQTPLPVLRVEMWRKRVVGLGDECLGYSEISAAPLLLYTGAPAERWLQLRSDLDALQAGSHGGPPMVLVSAQFSPVAQRRPVSTRHNRVPSHFLLDSSSLGGQANTDPLSVEMGSPKRLGPQRRSVRSDIQSVAISELAADSGSSVGGANDDITDATDFANEFYESSEDEGEGEHLFRLQTYRKPVWCGYCGGILVGFVQQGFQCEACGIDVHKRCQLKANFATACGGRSLPIRHWNKRSSESDPPGESMMADNVVSGAGLVLIRAYNAHICGGGCGAWGHDTGGHRIEGDHYLRIRIGPHENHRTPTVFQSSAPNFDAVFTLQAPSHDAPLVLELVEAGRDRIVGQFTSAPIDILQRDYDALAARQALPSDQPQELPLLDPGGTDEVRGLLRARLAFEEDADGFFYSRAPRPVPKWQAIEGELSVESVRKLVNRIYAIIKWPQPAFQTLYRIFSWESPPLSALSLILFVHGTLVGSSEHILALPVLALLVHMTLAMATRRSGRFVQWWVEHGSPSMASDSLGLSDVGFRPLAQLRVAILRGRCLLSEDLGLPGNAFVRVSYFERRTKHVGTGQLAAEDADEGADEESAGVRALIGETAPHWPASSDPDWSRSSELGTGRGRAGADPKTLTGGDVLLQNVPEVWQDPSNPGGVGHMALIYPILQPLASPSSAAAKERGGELIPWVEAPGFLKFEVLLANPFNSMMDSYLGEVRVPLSSLVSQEREARGGAQPEISGWYPLHGNNISPDAAIMLRMQLLLRNGEEPVTPEELEASRAIAVLLNPENRSDAEAEGASSSSSNPITAVLKLRNSVEDIQRTISSILDTVERVKNLLNWSQQPKTSLIYSCAILLWLILLAIPSRYVVFALGMAAFGSGFARKYRQRGDHASIVVPHQPGEDALGGVESSSGPHLPGATTTAAAAAAAASSTPMRLHNLLYSVPKDADLERTYRWQAAVRLKSLAAKNQERRQRARAQALGLGCQWRGTVLWRAQKEGASWDPKFLVVQGHRLAWWGSASALEEGKAAEGQLLLQGHAGVTGPSPVESRLVRDPSMLVCAFGRGASGRPMRCLFQVTSIQEKNGLERTILSAMETKLE